MRKDQDARIVIIASGSFQGKTIIALEVATKFDFSGIITTDTIRNVLKVLGPDKDYLSTSTYLLPEPLLLKQMEEVSNVIRAMIDIYTERGEHLVIEGMHFSEDFMEWAKCQDFHRIFINNNLPLRDRVILKNTTRSRLGYFDPVSLQKKYGKIDEFNVDNSSYIKYQERIIKIHASIRDLCILNEFDLIEFDNIDDGISKTFASVDSWLSN